MQTYTIPTAQDNRRANFPKLVAAATTKKELEGLIHMACQEWNANTEFDKHLESIDLIIARAKELRRGISDDVQGGEEDTNDLHIRAFHKAPIALPHGWEVIEAAA